MPIREPGRTLISRSIPVGSRPTGSRALTTVEQRLFISHPRYPSVIKINGFSRPYSVQFGSNVEYSVTKSLYNITGVEHTYLGHLPPTATVRPPRWRGHINVGQMMSCSLMYCPALVKSDTLLTASVRRHTGHCESETTHWSLRF